MIDRIEEIREELELNHNRDLVQRMLNDLRVIQKAALGDLGRYGFGVKLKNYIDALDKFSNDFLVSNKQNQLKRVDEKRFDEYMNTMKNLKELLCERPNKGISNIGWIRMTFPDIFKGMPIGMARLDSIFRFNRKYCITKALSDDIAMKVRKKPV